MPILKVGINGACGKMGIIVGKLLCSDKDIEISQAIEDANSQFINKDYGEILGIGKINVIVDTALKSKVDVLLDFSTPNAVIKRLQECIKFKVPIVIGTTGLGNSELNKIKNVSRKIPCLISPNMSVGMNLLFKLCPKIAKSLGKNL